jgi:hypothetical protein
VWTHSLFFAGGNVSADHGTGGMVHPLPSSAGNHLVHPAPSRRVKKSRQISFPMRWYRVWSRAAVAAANARPFAAGIRTTISAFSNP